MIEPRILKTVIVDDSSPARRLLGLLLKEISLPVQIMGEASTVDEAVSLIGKEKPDLVFLDIEMPGKSGLTLLDELAGAEHIPDIIFTTAYNQYAIDAFRLSAIDYLLKPIDENLLEKAVAKASERSLSREYSIKLAGLLHNLKETDDRCISIPVRGGFELIKVNDILYFEADGSYTRIITQSGKSILVSKNLKHFESQLNGVAQFFRIHRSFLVNMNHVSKIEKNQALISNGFAADISADRKDEFLEQMRKRVV